MLNAYNVAEEKQGPYSGQYADQAISFSVWRWGGQPWCSCWALPRGYPELFPAGKSEFWFGKGGECSMKKVENQQIQLQNAK